MAFLIATGGHRKELTPSGDLIGSAEHAQVRVPAEMGVAGEHYRVGLTPSGWQVLPIAPTLLNGVPVEGLSALAPGDQLAAGSLMLEFQDAAPVQEQTAAPAPSAEENIAAPAPAGANALSGVLDAVEKSPKAANSRAIPKLAIPAAAGILLLAGGAFAAWKTGILPFGKGDPHFALLAEYAPSGSDGAGTLDLAAAGKFYDHWRPEISPDLPTLADVSAKMKTESGVGIDEYERVSLVGSSEALSAISAAGATGKDVDGVAAVLTFAEGTDIAPVIEKFVPGVTKKDTGEGFSLYHTPEAKGLAARVIDGRHVVLTTVANHLDPSGSMSAKPHVKALRKSGHTLAMAGAIPTDGISMGDSVPMPSRFRWGVDLPAGIDLSVALDFDSKGDAEKAGGEFEKLKGMLGMFASASDQADMAKSMLNRLELERDGKTQTIRLSLGESELAGMAKESMEDALARNGGKAPGFLQDMMAGFAAGKAASTPPATPDDARARRHAQNIVSVYSAAVAAQSPELIGVSDPEVGARKIVAGVHGSAEAGFDTTLFSAPMEEDALARALENISWDEERGALSYTPKG